MAMGIGSLPSRKITVRFRSCMRRLRMAGLFCDRKLWIGESCRKVSDILSLYEIDALTGYSYVPNMQSGECSSHV